MDKYSLVIGRFQPLHEGHVAMIEKLLAVGKRVCVAIMDTALDKDNPYSVNERIAMFRERWGYEIKITIIPAIAEVCYGRDVGYDIRRIRHDKEGVSASALRKSEAIKSFYDEDFLDSYQKMAEKIHHLMAQHGFWEKGPKRDVWQVIALAHSELSEALECFRWGKQADKNIDDMMGTEVQLADVLGILMDMEIGYGLQISKALIKKMEFNKTRGYMHGGKLF